MRAALRAADLIRAVETFYREITSICILWSFLLLCEHFGFRKLVGAKTAFGGITKRAN